MSRFLRVSGSALLLCAAAACGPNASKSAEPLSPRAAPDAKKVDASKAGGIAGKVVVDGPLPANPTIAMASDPTCLSANKDGVTAESYVASDGGLENVFVYIKDGLGNKYLFDVPTDPVKIVQKGCRYYPHVVGARVAQPIAIANEDDTLHNVHAVPIVNREFNFSEPVPMTQTASFTAKEVMIPLKCEVHSWMHAYVGVLDHPYFAVTGKGGTFNLRTVPAGTYTIEAWHEKLGTTTQTVTLGEKDSKEITFTFKAPEVKG